MFPLFPFAAGLIAGGLAVRYWRSGEARAGVKSAFDALAGSARHGFDALCPSAGEVGAAETPAAPKKKASPRGKAVRKRARKGAVKS
ncbi:MAG: hypothetical protein HS110_02865 [Zoogloeaceae bacterium]|nr:hypothetical protein [Zoogloeaceae bacterium]MCK6385358.1 hypothetical protein [Rhodocyclaceae bacterium]